MQCKLCLEDVAELQNSHYLPAGIFKALRDDEGDNPNPFHLTRQGKTFQSSRQMRAYLLCSKCEERFNKCGEDWVLRNCLPSGQDFPIRDLLEAAGPAMTSPTTATKIFLASQVLKINISALAYFATSIFWRGSIYPWDTDGSIPVPLGRYGEDFRRFLMDEATFPSKATLWVIMRQDPKVSTISHAPHAFKMDGVHSYRFAIPGLGFVLMVGNQIQTIARQMCFVAASGNPIIQTDVVDRTLHNAVEKHILRDVIRDLDINRER